MHELTKSISAALVSILSWIIAAATLSNIALLVGIAAGIYSMYASHVTVKKNNK